MEKFSEKRVVWEQSEWGFIARGVDAAKKLHPTWSREAIISAAVAQLPVARQRNVIGANAVSIWKRVHELLAQAPEQVATPVIVSVPSRAVPAINVAKTMTPETVVQEIVSEKKELSMENIQALLNNHALEQRIFLLEQEKRIIAMMDRVYIGQMKFWTGDDQFNDSLLKDEQQSVLDKITAFQQVGRAALKKNNPLPGDMPSQHKPRVLVFGAKEDQREMIQREVPQVRVEVAKELKQAGGHYALVVLLKDFCRQTDKDHFRNQYKGSWIEVSGAKTRAVEAIKNHLALA